MPQKNELIKESRDVETKHRQHMDRCKLQLSQNSVVVEWLDAAVHAVSPDYTRYKFHNGQLL